VEVDVGAPLRWIALSECNQYWKAIADNIADAERFLIENFPNEFAFVASEWEGRLTERLIVLEMHH
jgi:hypothetical protein